MALTKEQKQKQIKDIKKNISNQKSVIFVDFNKVSSKDMFGLRKTLKDVGCNLKIAKKTLVRIAFGQSNISFWNKIKESVPGQLALVLGIDSSPLAKGERVEDEVAPARIANKFSKDHETFKILCGIFENKFIGREEILVLANLPSKQELLGKVVGSIAAPMFGFMNILQGNIKGLVVVLSKINKK